MAQSLNLKIKGLFLNPNDLSEVPPGALVVADNIVIDKESIAESRRGHKTYGNVLPTSTGEINKLFNYKNSLVCHYNNKLAYDSDNSGTWVDYSGTYSAPDAGFKIRSVEANRNFFLTTSGGVFKLDSITATPKISGAVKALDGYGSITGTVGFMSTNTQVSYRVVWGYQDVNHNLILGAPSQRIIVSNSSGGTRDVSLTFTIPSNITTDWFYQIYRSGESTSSTDEPNDEMQLVIEDNPTAGQISALSITVIDSTPNSLKGAILYTSPSQEGIANANEAPPFCKDLEVFKDHIFYANVKSKHRMYLNLVSVDSPTFGYYVDSSTGTASGSPILSTIADITKIRVGMRIVGTGIPSGTTVLNIRTSTSLTMSANATATASVSVEFQDRVTIAGVDYFGGSTQIIADRQFQVYSASTPAENIADTALDLIEVINKSSTTIYAYYISGFTDLPGKILLEEKGLGGNTFYATSTYGRSFSPILPLSGSTIDSDNEEKINRIFISKTKQPEAVPLYSYIDIGSADDAIKRIVSSRDTLFVFKKEGIYRITGEDYNTFRVTLLDNTTSIVAPETAVAFNSQVMIFSDQGVAAISDSGVQILSRPIESTLLQLSSEQYTNFEKISFAIGYESSRQYILFTGTDKSDTFATQAFVYNSFTNSWTRWVLSRTCGLISKRDNKMYTGHPTNDFIYQERKNFNLTDFADEEYPVTIVSASTLYVTVASITNIKVGMSLKQVNSTVVVQAINGLILTVDKDVNWVAGDAAIYTPISTKLQYVPCDIDNPGILKHFKEITMLFKDAAFNKVDVGFNTNFSGNDELVTVVSQAVGAFGSFPFGKLPFGGGIGGQQAIRTFIPLEKQRGHWLNVSVYGSQAFTSFSLAGISLIYDPMSERFK
jgi:hypothetical protein